MNNNYYSSYFAINMNDIFNHHTRRQIIMLLGMERKFREYEMNVTK